jgi:hypothetical protein
MQHTCQTTGCTHDSRRQPMSARQRIIAVFVLVIGLVISGCGLSPVLPPTPTMEPLAPPPAPSVTQVSIFTEMVTPPSTPISFVTEVPVSLGLEGTYNIKGIAPDGKAYSSKLTIILNTDYSGSPNKQAVYHLAWDNGSTGGNQFWWPGLRCCYLLY